MEREWREDGDRRDEQSSAQILYNGGPLVVPWRLGNDKGAYRRNAKVILTADVVDLCKILDTLTLWDQSWSSQGRNAGIGMTQASTVLLGLWRIHRMHLDNSKSFLDKTREKFFFRVPNIDLQQSMQNQADKSIRRVRVPSLTLEVQDFGEMNLDEFDRIHNPACIETPPGGAAAQGQQLAEMTFEEIFTEELQERRRARKSNKQAKKAVEQSRRGTYIDDETLMTMLMTNPNVVTDIANITMSEAEEIPTAPEHIGFGDEEWGETTSIVQPSVSAAEPSVTLPVEQTESAAEAEVGRHLETNPTVEIVPEAPDDIGALLGENLARRIHANRRTHDESHINMGPPPKRSRGRQKKLAELMDDDLQIPEDELKDRHAKPDLTLEQLLEHAKSLRPSQRPALTLFNASRRDMAKAWKSIRGVQLGGPLREMVDEIEAEIYRNTIDKQPPRRINPVVSRRSDTQDAFDRNIMDRPEQDVNEPRPSIAPEMSLPEVEAITEFPIIDGGTADVTAEMAEQQQINQVTPPKPEDFIREESTFEPISEIHTPLDEAGRRSVRRPTLQPVSEVDATIEEAMEIDNVIDQATADPSGVKESSLKTFREIFPPITTSRMKAAAAFHRFLKLQAQRKVELIQHEFCGDILIKPL